MDEADRLRGLAAIARIKRQLDPLGTLDGAIDPPTDDKMVDTPSEGEPDGVR
jgi:hypothetical protein